MLGAFIGITRPAAVTWLNSDLFTYALGFLMLSMGLTLTVEDFKKVRGSGQDARRRCRQLVDCRWATRECGLLG